MGLGTQAQGWGQWGSGVKAGSPGSPKEEKQPGNNRQLGAGGRRAGSASTRVAQGSSGGRAGERASGREALQERNAHFTR